MSVPETPEVNRLRGGDVLVLSQHFVRRGLASVILKQSGSVVTEAATPEEASDALQCHVFDAVIADVVGLHEQQREAVKSALLLRRSARLFLIAKDDDALPGLSANAILKPEVDKQEILCAMAHVGAAAQSNA